MKSRAKLVEAFLCVILAVPSARADQVPDLQTQVQALQQQMNGFCCK